MISLITLDVNSSRRQPSPGSMSTRPSTTLCVRFDDTTRSNQGVHPHLPTPWGIMEEECPLGRSTTTVTTTKGAVAGVLSRSWFLSFRSNLRLPTCSFSSSFFSYTRFLSFPARNVS